MTHPFVARTKNARDMVPVEKQYKATTHVWFRTLEEATRTTEIKPRSHRLGTNPPPKALRAIRSRNKS